MRTSHGPRPDTYNPLFIIVRERQPSWSFGSGNRSNLAATGLCSPAPGTYNLPNRGVEGVKRSMGMKLDMQSAIGQETRKTRDNPGPGTYKPKDALTIRSYGIFTIKSRPQTKEVERSPGPGAYNIGVSPSKSPKRI